MTDTPAPTAGAQTSEYRMTIRAAAIFAAVMVANKAIEAAVLVMTGLAWVGIDNVQMGILAAALSGGAGVYTYGRGSVKKAASRAEMDPGLLSDLANRIVKEARK